MNFIGANILRQVRWHFFFLPRFSPEMFQFLISPGTYTYLSTDWSELCIDLSVYISVAESGTLRQKYRQRHIHLSKCVCLRGASQEAQHILSHKYKESASMAMILNGMSFCEHMLHQQYVGMSCCLTQLPTGDECLGVRNNEEQ